MDRDTVLANIYLKAILPLIGEVLDRDEEAKKIAGKWKCSIMLFVGGGGPGSTLVFKGGKCEGIRKKVSMPSIALFFPNAAKLNSMFEGAKVMPVPVLGIWHPMVLMKFESLAKRLDYYMKPSEDLLKDRAAFAFIVELMLYAALNGACQVAMNDPAMKEIADHTPDGVMQVSVKDGPKAYLVKKGNDFSVFKGESQEPPKAIMEFKDIDLAYNLFKGQVDAMAALGGGDIRIRGLVPFVDNVNACLDQLGTYLNK